jgi:hypothetical protein
MLYKELDFPKISDLYTSYNEDFLKNNFQDISPYPEYSEYRLYRINDNSIEKFLQPYFSFDLTNMIRCQVIKKNIIIHKDVNREIVYNYILDCGGNDVLTVWYDEDKTTELLNVKIPKNTWHVMDVTKFHTVKNITETRIALTIFQSTKDKK